MCAMARTLRRPRRTLDEFLALPEDTRAEFIGGEILVSPSPDPRHQGIVGELHLALRGWADRGRGARVYFAPFDLHLATGDVVQPDLLVLPPPPAGGYRQPVRATPLLVVEVLSPSSHERDLFLKRDLYARAGVPECWIVDPEARAVEVMRLAGSRYEPAGWFTEGTRLASPTLQGLALEVADLFEP
jgi:Uma2 family endonuclease